MGTSALNPPTPDSLQPHQSVQIWMPSKHMGNLLLSLRTIEALAKRYSGCRCTLVIDESYRGIMSAAHIPADIVYFPRKAIDSAGIVGKIKTTLQFIARTRRHKPVIAIAVEGDKISGRFLPLSGCGVSVGPDERYCQRLKIKVPPPGDNTHIFHTYGVIAGFVCGEAPAPGYVRLVADSATQSEIANLLASKLDHPKRPLAILHPCATKDYKQWPIESFAHLADHLADTGFNVVLTGAGEFDGQAIAKLQALSRRPVLSLHDQLNLEQFIALLGRANFFVGNDTGPTHLAASCDIPTFAIFGPTDESLWGPLGNNTTILRSAVACEPACVRRQCEVGYRCMRTLSPDTVIESINRCL